MTFPQKIRDFRDQLGYTQARLARLVGVSSISIVRWENGTSLPSPLAAEKLIKLGLTDIQPHETKLVSTPRIKNNNVSPQELRQSIKQTLNIDGRTLAFEPAPYISNGPLNQHSFFETLIGLQEKPSLTMPLNEYIARLSVVATAGNPSISTSQFRLEKPASRSKHWDPNYGPHGWHRYVGRFPAHLVRALLNHFDMKRGSLVLDPFLGSGTTLVEARLLGLRAIGVDICPLSCLMSRVKAKFPKNLSKLKQLVENVGTFYNERWTQFTSNKDADKILHTKILDRPGNHIPRFPNVEKWFSPSALLGTSLILEFILTTKGYEKEALACALSSAMRSIGNVDVDVVRAEYSKTPRTNVNVLSLVQRVLQKMIADISDSLESHSELLSQPNDIDVIEGNILNTKIVNGSVDAIVTSPPYGVESMSYLRTHLLSYRSLHALLKRDPYEYDHEIIGSEYIKDTDSTDVGSMASKLSPAFTKCFEGRLTDKTPKNLRNRTLMMMKFFDDMVRTSECLRLALKENGRLAFVIGNKRLGDDIIPTDEIVTDIFQKSGFRLTSVIKHKLKCNNSNSEVPWQERTIQDEYALLFQK